MLLIFRVFNIDIVLHRGGVRVAAVERVGIPIQVSLGSTSIGVVLLEQPKVNALITAGVPAYRSVLRSRGAQTARTILTIRGQPDDPATNNVIGAGIVGCGSITEGEIRLPVIG